MKLNKFKIDIEHFPKIIKKITKNELNKFYQGHLDNGIMHPAQWFANAMKWYQIHTYNNPYNIGRPNAELNLLLDNKQRISSTIRKYPLVFWGVGKSDTEMEIINFHLEANGEIAYIIAIDINHKFLRDFSNALRDKVKEKPQLKIYFLGINNLFENISFEHLNYFTTSNRLHICLGNTVGNYEKINDIIRIFKRNSVKGDMLLLGFQSNKLVDLTFRRYNNNKYLEALFTYSLYPKFSEVMRKKKIKWKYDNEKQQIEAWLDNIQVFRSKKFNPDKLKSILRDSNYVLKKQFKDKFTTCIQFYKYIANKCLTNSS